MTDDLKPGGIDPKTMTPAFIDSKAAGGAYSDYNPYDPAYTGAVGGGPYLGESDAHGVKTLAEHREKASAERRKALSKSEREAEDAIAAEAKAEAERLYGDKPEAESQESPSDHDGDLGDFSLGDNTGNASGAKSGSEKR